MGREKKYDAYLGISGLETQDRVVREGGENRRGIRLVVYWHGVFLEFWKCSYGVRW